MRNQQRWILIVGIGVVLVGVAVEEYLHRRVVQQRYVVSEEARRELTRELTRLATVHQDTQVLLQREREQTHALTEMVAEQRTQLDETITRLTEVDRTTRALQLRLVTMEQQLGQVQGELALALERFTAQQPESDAVQLERVVISRGAGQPLIGRVVSIDQEWRFVVINLGWDTVKIGDTVSILRNDQLLAKARIERVQERVAAATLLPDWQDVQVQVNDVVQIL
jgi:hypothetical protein